MIKLNDNLLNLYQEYINILITWQKSVNLISNNTIDEIWDRHIYDSLQLAKYINASNINIYDMGSGAGFPALVLAIYNQDNTYHLIESDTKKAMFLNTLKIKLNITNAIIHNDRIENLTKHHNKADIVTARALSSLNSLIKYALPLLKDNGYCLFLKGKNYQTEIDTAKKTYPNFDYTLSPSLTNKDSRIIKLTKGNNSKTLLE